MNKKIVFSLLVSVGFATLSAQKKDPIVVKIDGHPITKSEFEYIYHKNNTSAETDKKSLDDYLTLFVNYKLKVEEAKSQKLDTVPSFRKEYEGYKSQLAEPYLKDTVSELALAEQSYDRLGTDLEVSHILIPFSKTTLLPADTLKAYDKAMEVYAKLTDASHPISFEEAAKTFSSDKSGEKPGYLGWVTGNMLVGPFENTIYSMKVGSISKPVRTKFGYHIILLHNKRKDPGQARVAHIMFATSAKMTQAQVDSVKLEADQMYQRLLSGGDYAELAKKYSYDKYSAEHGGEIGWVRVGSRFPAEWLEACLAIDKVNDFTKPVKTAYGYHIIKLLEKKPIDSFQSSKSQLVNFLKGGDHKYDLEKVEIDKLKKEYKTELNLKAYSALNALANTNFPTDSAYLAEAKNINLPLLKIEKNVYPVSDFVNFLRTEKPSKGDVSTEYLNNRFNAFLLTKLNQTKEQTLGEKYPDFRNLSNEYYDGILLFNIMNQEVWQKAEKDTAGLEKFFVENKTKYTWPTPKHKGYVIHCKNEVEMAKAKAIVAQYKGRKDLPELLSNLNDSAANVTIEVGTWGEGDNAYVDKEFYGKEIKKGKENKRFPLYFIEAREIDVPEEYSDVKGQIVSDYQDYLEKSWVASLHKKYKVDVNKKVLNSIQ